MKNLICSTKKIPWLFQSAKSCKNFPFMVIFAVAAKWIYFALRNGSCPSSSLGMFCPGYWPLCHNISQDKNNYSSIAKFSFCFSYLFHPLVMDKNFNWPKVFWSKHILFESFSSGRPLIWQDATTSNQTHFFLFIVLEAYGVNDY